MKAKELGRRRFLKEGAALAGLAVGAIRSASAWLLLVMTITVAPTSGTSAYAKPKATDTKASGVRSSQIRARSMISIAGDTPVP